MYLDCTGIVLGMYLGRTWIVTGLYLDCVWIVSGFYLNCSLIVNGLYLDFTWIDKKETIYQRKKVPWGSFLTTDIVLFKKPLRGERH